MIRNEEVALIVANYRSGKHEMRRLQSAMRWLTDWAGLYSSTHAGSPADGLNPVSCSPSLIHLWVSSIISSVTISVISPPSVCLLSTISALVPHQSSRQIHCLNNSYTNYHSDRVITAAMIVHKERSYSAILDYISILATISDLISPYISTISQPCCEYRTICAKRSKP